MKQRSFECGSSDERNRGSPRGDKHVMKIVIWNVRGAAGAAAQRDIVSLLNDVKPDVVFLLDTLVKETIIRSIALRTGFEDLASNQQQAEGIARIACFCRMGILSAIQCQASRWWIELAFKIGDYISSVKVFGVYQPNNPTLRSNCYCLLKEEINRNLCPVIMMGDCHAMRSQCDKTGRAPNPQSCRLFNEFIYDSNLQEIKSSPNAFTWSNRRQGDECILCKIDWCFINHYGANNLPVAYFLQHRARSSSDHKAMVLELRDKRSQEKRKRRFRFFKPWLNDSRGKEINNEAWATIHYGCPILRVLGKLTAVKKRLSRRNSEEFGRVDEKVKSLHAQLEQAQLAIDQTNLSATVEESIIRQELNCALLLEEIMWRNKSKKNKIEVLEVNGHKHETMEEMMEATTSFFDAFMNEDGATRDIMEGIADGKMVSEEENDTLLSPVTMEEVKQAVFGLDEDSAAGPDGFDFYQIMWPTIQHHIHLAISNFFSCGKFVKSINRTNLMLIPKFP
ncbi:hypothetical protein EJ110_NYTH32946 [Nymphaea thermarum]|nr:hypothetical protein EJ110_NYTH32946 [Nymphaea thermarum]